VVKTKNRALKPRYVVVLEQKMGKNQAKKCPIFALIFRGEYRWHRVILMEKDKKFKIISCNTEKNILLITTSKASNSIIRPGQWAVPTGRYLCR
jgi:hypothetical protein